MDVQLPSGQVIKGIPEGTTKAQLAEKLTKNGIDVPKEWMSSSAPEQKTAPAPESSATGAFARSAVQQAAPTAAGVASFAPGFAAGASLGALTGPAAPIASPVLGVAGGIATSMLGAKVASEAQDKITAMIPESLKDAVGMGKKQLQADEQQHPLATFAGGMAPQAAFMRPGNMKPLATVAGAGLSGGAEAARELQDGGVKSLDMAKIGMATGVGAAMQKPTKAGEKLGLSVTPKVDANARAKVEQVNAQAEQKVRAAGVDWSKLPRATRKYFTDLTKDSLKIDKLSPEEIKTVAKLAELPVPITQTTKGQRTRDPVQLRREELIANTDEGRAVRDLHLQQNEKLTANLDYLKGKTRAAARTESDVGRSVDAALQTKIAKSEGNINALYNKAREAGETNAPVKTDSLLEHIANHDDPAMVSYVENRLRALKAVKSDSEGNLVPTRELTLNEIEGIRRAAVARGKNGGTEGHYAGQVKKVIDEMTKDAGGELYKTARASRIKHALEFEDQQAVSKITDMKTRTDRVTAVEDVFSTTVQKGSVEDLQKVKKSLLTGGDAETRTSGRTAWREMRGQALQYLKDEATKGVATNERREANFSAAGMKRAVDKIGDEKLDVLFGKGTAKQIHKIMDAAVDLKTQPSGVKTGSDTVQKILALVGGGAEKVLDAIPGIGPAVKGVAKMGYEKGTATRDARKATESATPNKIPLADINRRRAIAANESLRLQDNRKKEHE